MKLTANFTYEEMITSDTARVRGIDNHPNAAAEIYISKLAREVLQPIRDAYKKPIIITSGYRSEALNKAVGGSKTSQHLKGQAADIKAADGNNKELFDCILKLIKRGKLKVGQLIWEYGSKTHPRWVHVSLPYTKVNNILYYYDK